jgi:5'-methylthioadenosine phosphorylase
VLSNLAATGHRVAIIAGTGFESAFSTQVEASTVVTPYGNVPAAVQKIENGEIVFIPRHGSSHAVPPHRINFRAQMWAIRELGAKYVLATSAVGSLRRDRQPGDVVILDDFIDFRGETTTYYDCVNGEVNHVDFSQPFSQHVRCGLIDASKSISEKDSSGPTVYQNGTYLCVSGPRYETPAEVMLFGAWGADVVGMTVAPEAILARELGLEYAAISVITNFGTGISETPLSHVEVGRQMARMKIYVVELFRHTVAWLFAATDETNVVK